MLVHTVGRMVREGWTVVDPKSTPETHDAAPATPGSRRVTIP
jgi:hypothetical protein